MKSDIVNYRNNKRNLIKLWIHECKRVFHDRLAFEEDIGKFNDYLSKAVLSISDSSLMILENDLKEMMGDSNIFTSFISQQKGESDPKYLPVNSQEELK